MAVSAKKISNPGSKFSELLQAQVGNELTASNQYLAVAVWFDRNDLPRLAHHFYRQAREERNHAMMMVKYLVDNGREAHIPAVEAVRNDFRDAAELIALALEQEREVGAEITALAAAARDESDYTGEQFIGWFLKEQVEEIAAMSTLLNVITRAKGNTFEVEAFLALEQVGDGGSDPGAPGIAGGRI